MKTLLRILIRLLSPTVLVLTLYGQNIGVIQQPATGGSGAVSSVFGRTGAVVAVNGDYDALKATPVGQIWYFEGSSITRGNTLGTAQLPNGGLTGNYGDVLSKSIYGTVAMSTSGAAYNDGVNGNTTTQVLAQYTTGNNVYGVTVPSAHSLSPAVTSSTTRHVYFLDLSPVYNDSNNSISTATSISNLQSIVNTAHTDGWIVVVLTCPVTGSTTAGATQISAVNQAVKDGTVVTDFIVDWAFTIPNQSDASLYSDGLHPNLRGHAALAAFTLATIFTQGGQVNYSNGYSAQVIPNKYNFRNNLGGDGTIVVENTANTGYTTFSFLDDGGTQRGGMGWGNSGVAFGFANQLYFTTNTSSPLVFGVNFVEVGRFETDGGWKLKGKNTLYNNVATVGWGHPAIYGTGRVTAQTAAAAAIATYTVGAADGTFVVSGNVNVTAATTASFTMTVTYTDETNTPRTLTLNFSNLTGTLLTTITNVTGTGAYEGVPLHIRCKASTAITFATVGTFTSVTYNAEGYITQIG